MAECESGGGDSLTRILEDLKAGVDGSEERLFEVVYANLRRMAHARMRKERPGTLNTTALVNEAYLRLSGDKQARWENRRHFFGAAALAMQRILVDKAKERKAAKRGGGRVRVPLLDDIPGDEPSIDLIAVDEALSSLEKEYPRHARVVRHRFFLGMTIDQTAELIDISPRAVVDDWNFARAWLRKNMSSRAMEK